MENKKTALVLSLTEEMNLQTSDPSVMRALLATSFKGFKSDQLVKQAILEAMINGYSFQDIIQKKVYAIPFGNGYSLLESISSVRSKAMQSGQAGKTAPVYTVESDGTIETCTVTVKKLVGGHICDYTATVYFDEYDKGRDNWKTKPRTMIAKVAEMHALRMAFPKELSQSYIEEEFIASEHQVIEARMDKALDASSGLTMGSLIKDNQDAKNEDQNEVSATEGNEEPSYEKV